MAFQDMDYFPCPSRPNYCLTIAPGRGDLFAVRREVTLSDPVVMAVKDLSAATRLSFPDSHCPVCASGNESFPARRKITMSYRAPLIFGFKPFLASLGAGHAA